MNPATALLIAKLLNFAMLAATKGPSMVAGLREHRDKIEAMIAEGRDPTPEEVAELDAALDHWRGQLHSVET